MGQVNAIDVGRIAAELVSPRTLPAPVPRRMGFVAALVAGRQNGSRGRG
jgi:hypothetical protein